MGKFYDWDSHLALQLLNVKDSLFPKTKTNLSWTSHHKFSGDCKIILGPEIRGNLENFIRPSFIPQLKKLARLNQDLFIFLSQSLPSSKFRNDFYNQDIFPKIKSKLHFKIKTGNFQTIKSLKVNISKFEDVQLEEILEPEFFEKALRELINGFHFKISATPRAVGNYELEKVGTITPDKNYTFKFKRGQYKFVVEHIMSKLNTSFSVFPSSGGGGTGIYSPKSMTWDGTMGDVLGSKAHLGFVAETFSRKPFVSFTLPISNEVLTFCMSPPRPLISGKNIFQPFTPTVWLLLLVTLWSMSICLVLSLSVPFRNAPHAPTNSSSSSFSSFPKLFLESEPESKTEIKRSRPGKKSAGLFKIIEYTLGT